MAQRKKWFVTAQYYNWGEGREGRERERILRDNQRQENQENAVSKVRRRFQ